MRSVDENTIDELIQLSRILGEFGQINRVVLLPDGTPETDSHHSFSLALIAYQLAKLYAPELDAHKILLYALVHDLPELITGDIVTLTATAEELEEKARLDIQALGKTTEKLKAAPDIVAALKRYEAKADNEALFVYWVDKIATIPTHFYDNGANLRSLGIHDVADIQQWYERTLVKLQKHGQPHGSAIRILEMAYQKLHDELVAPQEIKENHPQP